MENFEEKERRGEIKEILVIFLLRFFILQGNNSCFGAINVNYTRLIIEHKFLGGEN